MGGGIPTSIKINDPFEESRSKPLLGADTKGFFWTLEALITVSMFLNSLNLAQMACCKIGGNFLVVRVRDNVRN